MRAQRGGRQDGRARNAAQSWGEAALICAPKCPLGTCDHGSEVRSMHRASWRRRTDDVRRDRPDCGGLSWVRLSLIFMEPFALGVGVSDGLRLQKLGCLERSDGAGTCKRPQFQVSLEVPLPHMKPALQGHDPEPSALSAAPQLGTSPRRVASGSPSLPDLHKVSTTNSTKTQQRHLPPYLSSYTG